MKAIFTRLNPAWPKQVEAKAMINQALVDGKPIQFIIGMRAGKTTMLLDFARDQLGLTDVIWVSATAEAAIRETEILGNHNRLTLTTYAELNKADLTKEPYKSAVYILNDSAWVDGASETYYRLRETTPRIVLATSRGPYLFGIIGKTELAASWDWNPTIHPDDLIAECKRNPENAIRDFGFADSQTIDIQEWKAKVGLE